MASDTEIANAALLKLGAARITELTEDVDRARTLNARYNQVREAELRRHRWKFSLARTTLPALSTTPDFGYDLEYQVPTGFLALIQVGDFDVSTDLTDYRSAPIAPYSLEGRKILTNLMAPLPVRFVIDVTDVATMDTAFREAFASRLAYECCERITGKTTKRQLAMADYKLSVREGIRSNAIESPPKQISDDTWVTARAL